MKRDAVATATSALCPRQRPDDRAQGIPNSEANRTDQKTHDADREVKTVAPRLQT